MSSAHPVLYTKVNRAKTFLKTDPFRNSATLWKAAIDSQKQLITGE